MKKTRHRKKVRAKCWFSPWQSDELLVVSGVVKSPTLVTSTMFFVATPVSKKQVSALVLCTLLIKILISGS